MSKRTFALNHGAYFHREPKDSDALFVAQGEQIGCEAGHVCWTSTRGIYHRQIISCDDMAPAPYQTTPSHGRKMGQCICGRHYVEALYDGPVHADTRSRTTALHIVGKGWRRAR